MSLIWTESFAGFRKGVPAIRADLQAAGYTVSGNRAEWQIIDDMIVPGHVLLTPVMLGEEGGSATLARPLPAYTAPVFIGFSVYVPAYYARPGDDAAALLTFRNHESVDGEGSELYRIRRDLRVSLGENNPQNAALMTPARVHYVEVRIALGEVRVWLDDVFVLQHTRMDMSPMTWSINLAATEFGIGNLYVLNEDSVYPNVRLGRATRVIGERPSADIETGFERPVIAESNAAVVGQDFAAEPSAVLQGANAGDRDVYSVGGTGAETASSVHAIAVKVRAMNADVTPRAVSAFVELDGHADIGTADTQFHYLEPFTDDDILCSTVIPNLGAAVGTRRGQIWFSKNGEQFDCVAESGGAAVTDMTVKSNVVIAVCEDGRAMRGNFSITPVTWSLIDTPATQALRAVAANETRIIAVGDAGLAIASADGTMDTWTMLPTNVSSNLTAVSFADPHWLIAGSFDDSSLRISLNNGDTWLNVSAPKPRIDGPLRIRTLNGRTVVMGSGEIPIATRLAVVGYDTPFYTATKVGNLEAPAPCIDCVLSDGVFLLALEDGTTLVSEDALTCQLSERLDMQIMTLARLDDGRVLVAGGSGRMYLRAAMPAITELPVLSGYANGFAAVTCDPSTGRQWTPLTAALSNIGLRISDVPRYGDTGNYLLTEDGLRILDEYGRKILLEDFTK